MHVDVDFLQYYSGFSLSSAGKVAWNAKNFSWRNIFMFFFGFYDFISLFCCCLVHTYVNNKENTRKCNKFLVDYKNSYICLCVCVCVFHKATVRGRCYTPHTRRGSIKNTSVVRRVCTTKANKFFMMHKRI